MQKIVPIFFSLLVLVFYYRITHLLLGPEKGFLLKGNFRFKFFTRLTILRESVKVYDGSLCELLKGVNCFRKKLFHRLL